MEVDKRGTFTFIWRIENITNCLETKGERFTSPVFIIDALDRSRWCIRLYPNDQHLKYYIVNVTSKSREITADFRLFLMGCDGRGRNRNNKWVRHRFQYNIGLGIKGFPTLEEVYETKRSIFLPKDTLTIVCQLRKLDSDLDQHVECSARTLIGLKRFSKLWKVQDVVGLGLKEAKSTTVSSAENGDSLVILRMTREGESFLQKWLNIEICRKKCDEKSLLSCKISVLNNIGQSVKEMFDRCLFQPGGEATWTFPKFIFLSELVKRKSYLLFENTLSLRFEFTLSNGVEYSKIEATHMDLVNVSCVTTGTSWNGHQKSMGSKNGGFLKGDMLSLYHDKTLSDFELKAGDSAFPVHKAILCARSPVFKAMLTTDMLESDSKSLSVPDVNADTMAKFLLYVYTGSIEDLDLESAYDLYYASDKYQVLSLKQKCSFALKSHLTVQNVSTVLALADEHQDNELMSVAQDFILQYDGEVMHSVEWLEFDKSHTQLASKTMYQVYKKKLQVKL